MPSAPNDNAKFLFTNGESMAFRQSTSALKKKKPSVFQQGPGLKISAGLIDLKQRGI